MRGERGIAAGAATETELVLRCARNDISPVDAERIETLVSGDLDWEFVLQISRRHGVLALLYRNLVEISPSEIPTTVTTRLRERFREHAQRTFYLVHQLLDIISLFEAHDIPMIPYKGPTLSVAAYGSVTARVFSDLDVLVRREDVPRARELLRNRGYEYLLHLTANQEETFVKNDELPIFVDLHWSPIPRYHSLSLDFESLRQNFDRVTLGHEQVSTLPRELLLLIVCIHSTKHSWKRLEWISSVAALARQPDVETTRLVEQAREWDVERFLLLGLLLAHDLLDASIDEQVLDRAKRDSVVRSLTAHVHERFVQDPLFSTTYRERVRFRAAAIEPLQDKIGCYYHAVISPSTGDFEFLSLPPLLHPAYYAIRPARLFGKGLYRVVETLTR